jgi:signal transduction histidine kinase/CheY-like chemotaxis protein
MFEQKKPSILVVDDNVPAVEMLSRLFSGNNFLVHKAYTGQQALDSAIAFLPDLILLDVMMPGMNGYEVMTRLAANPLTKDIPTIFITAKDTPADIEQGFDLGAVDYIPKPAEPRELLARTKNKIEAKFLKESLNKKTQDLEVLLNVSNALNAHLNVTDLIKLIASLILKYTPSKTVVIFYQNEFGHFSYSQSLDVQFQLSEAEVVDGANYLASNLATADVAVLPPLWWQQAQGYGIAIRKEGTLHGVVMAFPKEYFENGNLILLEGITKQATIALKNADLYELKTNYAIELERLVSKRTEELISAQNLLIRSEKLASVGRLASAIAHEINNPLTPVVLNLELMVEDIKANHAINMADIDIEATYNSAQRIKRIVERILQFTRKGREDRPAMEKVDITRVIANTTALIKHYFQKSGIELVTNIQFVTASIYGNADQLEQVFLNMMLNARDAMQEKGKLTVSAFLQDDWVIVKFSDSGKGIAPEIMDKLFEPFTSTKGENGSGLGLFVSFEIVRNHNGIIEVESELEKGTTFTIKLPTNL